MIKKAVRAACTGAAFVCGILFVLVAAPVIHLAGLDDTGRPTKEDIDRSNDLAERLAGRKTTTT